MSAVSAVLTRRLLATGSSLIFALAACGPPVYEIPERVEANRGAGSDEKDSATGGGEGGSPTDYAVSIRASVRSAEGMEASAGAGVEAGRREGGGAAGAAGAADSMDEGMGSCGAGCGGRPDVGGGASTAAQAGAGGNGATGAVPSAAGTSVGGVSATGGEPTDAGGNSATGRESTSTAGTSDPGCSGVPYEGICWYLGELGASCEETCTDHGGLAKDAASYVGTATQGGSLEECATLLELLGADGTVTAGSRTILGRLGLGCHMLPDYGPSSWWLTAPDFDPEDSLFAARIVCGCEN